MATAWHTGIAYRLKNFGSSSNCPEQISRPHNQLADPSRLEQTCSEAATMSGYEIIALISTSIEIIKIIGEFYTTIKTYEGLPKAFKEVNKQLPLVQDTLTRAKGRISGLDAPTKLAVKGVLKQCEENLKGLVNIFEVLKDAEGKSLKKVYTRAVITIGKRGRVEDLMKDTLSNVKQLAENQVFQVSDQVEGLQKAIDDLTKVAPSIPDAEFEKALGTAGFTMIGDYNTQFGNSGDAFHAPNGQFYQAGDGTFNYNHYTGDRSVAQSSPSLTVLQPTRT
jgi:hypothetical protein